MAETSGSSESIQELAQSIAQQIVARQGQSQSQGHETIELGGDLTGSFTLAIKYGTDTYTLTVTIPGAAGGEYVFSLTMTPDGKTAENLASFKYKDESNWAVGIGLPAAVTFGGITIQTLSLALGEGTVS